MANQESTPHDLQTESRQNLDGGLDTRSGIFGKPGRATSLVNMTFQQTDSLSSRKGGTKVARVAAVGAVGDLLGFSLDHANAGGTIPDATYSVKYALRSLVDTGVVVSGAKDVTTVGGGTSIIDVHIEAVDSGEGVGAVDFGGSANTKGADLPQNCGYAFSTVVGNANAPRVYAKTGADGYTLQTLTSITYVIPVAGRPYYRVRFSAYTNTGAADPGVLGNSYISMRSMASHPDLDALFGWVGEHAVYLHGPAVGSPTFFNGAVDKFGNPYFFSRWPSRVQTVMLNKVMWAFDGLGKPKRLHWTGSAATSRWMIAGANSPGAPTPTDTGAGAGPAAGVYDYAIAFVFSYKNADGTILSAESIPSPIGTVTSTAKTISVAWTASLETSPVNPDGTSSSVAMVRIYRTAVGGGTGSQLYFLADVKDGVGSPYSDDGTVAVNVDITPTDSLGKVAPDTPPPKLYYPCVHDGRIWASPQQWDIDATTLEILRLRGGGQLRLTDESGDEWPLDARYTIECGGGRITGLRSFRGTLYVFKEDSIGIIEGSDPNSYGYREIFSGIGALPNSLVVQGNDVFFWDNAKGPCILNGYSASELGIEEVQLLWQQNQVLTPYIRDAFYDRRMNEIRWIATSAQNGPSSWIAEPRVDEYVLYGPSVRKATPAFGLFRAGVAPVALNSDRRITAVQQAIGTSLTTDPAARNTFAFYCDTYGRYCQDDLVGYDTSPTNNAEQYNIDYSMQQPFFFGADPEMSKQERFLCAIFELGGVLDTISFSAFFLGKAATFLAPSAWGPIAGTAPLVGIDQWKRLDFDAATFGNLEQRGVKVQVAGVSRAGPVRLKLLSCRYRDVSNIRNV